MKDNDSNKSRNTKKNNSNKADSAAAKGGKAPGKRFVRTVVLVVVFCAVVLTIILVSGIFRGGSNSSGHDFETITVSGNTIVVNGDRTVTLQGLREHLESALEINPDCIISLIDDPDNPAEVTLYNEVVDLLATFGKSCAKKAATTDELKLASPDESAIPTAASKPTVTVRATAAA